MRLITCSNSAPDIYIMSGNHQRDRFFASPGGLVPMMTALLAEMGGQWIFNAAGLPRGKSALGTLTDSDVVLRPIWIPDELSRPYREDYCVKTLLWLFHYLHDTSLRQEPPPGSKLAWEAYYRVNQMFADALAAACENARDEVILINDLHLLLTPHLFTKRLTRREFRLIYFHHVPWCEPEYFGIIPEYQRQQILTSVLSADIAGFHSNRWARAFSACCACYISGAKVDGTRIHLNGHTTQLVISPGAVDKTAISRLLDDVETGARQQELRKIANGRLIIARVDRMDLWKNHVRGFAAYEKLLTSNPDLVRDLWFCAVASPTRLQTPRHLSYRAMCEDMVDRINRRFGVRQEAVTLLYPENHRHARCQAAGALSLASVTLVNPTWDGLNLVAKESVLLGDCGQVVLSANAGVHDQLGAASLSINPFDEDATAEALRTAIDASATDAASRARRALEALADESAANWLSTLLNTSALETRNVMSC